MIQKVPTGFVPASDQGYAIVAAQMPDGASLERTDAVVRKALDIIKEVPGVGHTVAVAGFSGATFTAASNAAAIFVAARVPSRSDSPSGQTADTVVAELQKRLFAIQDGFIIVIKPPTVQGLGQGGGFKLQIQDRSGVGLEVLRAAHEALIAKANQTPGLAGVFTTFSTALAPALRRYRPRQGDACSACRSVTSSRRCRSMSARPTSTTSPISAAPSRSSPRRTRRFRVDPEDLTRIKVRSTSGALVPLGSLVALKTRRVRPP